MVEMLSMVDICKSHGRGGRRVRILRDVSLSVGAGEIAGIVGSPRGGGTLLQVAAGWIQPDAGQIRLGETYLTALSKRKREGLCSQHVLWIDDRLPPADMKVTAHDHVYLTLRADSRINRHEATRRAQYGLERMGVSELASIDLKKLTYWERLLVELARIVTARRPLVLINNLFDGLGGTAQTQDARRLLRSLVDEVGCAVLLRVSDLMSAWVADCVWRFDRGELNPVANILSRDHEGLALVPSDGRSEDLSDPNDAPGLVRSDVMMPSYASARLDEMPTISRFMGIVIAMYFDDHPPPHFHARSGEFSAKIRTDTLELLVGDLPRRELRLVLAWAELHAPELQENWHRAREGETLLAIEPLQ
jgi:predicted ABC-type transport system involved in lysophospholipase L1 biosynthesis ATPase subunit